MQELKEMIEARHSVRRYKPEYLSAEDESKLIRKIEEINQESGLSVQFVDGRDTSIPETGFQTVWRSDQLYRDGWKKE